MYDSVKGESPSAYIIEHYGTKGMKWGVRKSGERKGVVGAYGDRQIRKAASERRTATGAGSAVDLGRTFLTRHPGVLAVEMAVVKGSPGTAVASRANRREEHVRRIREGEATVTDLLKVTTRMSALDVARSRQRQD